MALTKKAITAEGSTALRGGLLQKLGAPIIRVTGSKQPGETTLSRRRVFRPTGQGLFGANMLQTDRVWTHKDRAAAGGRLLRPLNPRWGS